MKVVNVSTFLPTQCGLATFSNDLVNSLALSPLVADTQVVAVSPDPKQVFFPPVMAVIKKQVKSDYRRVARLLNRFEPDVVMIQHEYGIFGGPDGSYILDFVDELRIPYAVTLHTVLPKHSAGQSRVLKKLCAKAKQVLVFTSRAEELMNKAKLCDAEKMRVVPHGAPPEITKLSLQPIPKKTNRKKTFLVTSFGLLAPRKGVDLTIKAISLLAKQHPEIQMVVAGDIHPEVRRRQGAKYEEQLESLVKRHGLQLHVTFQKQFLTIEELAELLARTELFVSAYEGKDQIVSGALTFALAAGCACVSTPYRYAQDMLSSGAGTLVPFGKVKPLARAIENYLTNPEKLRAARAEARRIGKNLSWPAVGLETAQILQASARRAA